MEDEIEKVSLFKRESSEISISIDAYFKNNQLIVSGYDAGELVNKLRGDWDYEYYCMVEGKAIKEVYTVFNVEEKNQKALLDKIKENFNGNHCYSKYREFLKDNQIKFSSFTWP